VRQFGLFPLVFVSSRWLSEHLSAMGMMLLGLTAFAGAFGVNTQINLAHQIFSLGISLLAVDAAALAVLRRRRTQLSAQRQLPEFASCDQAFRYRIEVRNEGHQATLGHRVVEKLHQPWPQPADRPHRWGRAARPDPGRRARYPGFLELLLRLRVLEVEPVGMPPLLPGQSVTLELSARPTARGLAVFESLHWILPGPLGLVESRMGIAASPATLPVLPSRLPVQLPPPASHRLLQPGGITQAQHVGDAEEFRSLRDYRPGDPLRNMHWRSFARTGRPMVREFQEEFYSRHTVLLDTAAPYPFAPEFETAVSMAAWMVVRPRDADSLLDLVFVGDRVHRVTTGRGLGGSDTLLRVLATVAPTPPGSIASLLSSFERNAAQVSSLVAIFLTWDEPRQATVRRLLARGLRPTVLVIETGTVLPVDLDDAFVGIVRRVTVPDLSKPTLPV